ncbi:MAG TPA: hypothetical protein VN816_03965 [Acidimicrobiales bacterium]|nr:hypothetical protein [Acidimicrobiales bacterium]
MRHTLRIGLLSVVGSMLVVGTLGVGTVAAKGAPTLMPRPDTKLVGGELIHLQGDNWPADDGNLVAWECDSSAHPTSAAYCDNATAVAVGSNGKGKLKYSAFTVTTGAVGDGMCGTDSADKVCYIAVYDMVDPAVHGVGKIVFEVPAT